MHKFFNYATWTNEGVKLDICMCVFMCRYTHTHTPLRANRRQGMVKKNVIGRIFGPPKQNVPNNIA